MPVRFRSIYVSGLAAQLPVTWVRAAQSHAESLWIRIFGLNTTSHDKPKDVQADRWERSMRLASHFRRSAYLGLYFAGYRAGGRVYPMDSAYDWKRDQDRAAADMRAKLNEVRAGFGGAIGICADDFAARWLVRSGFKPDAAILDNPMVGVDELKASPLAGLPGFIRASGGWIHDPEDLGMSTAGGWARDGAVVDGAKHGEWTGRSDSPARAAFIRGLPAGGV